MEQFIIALLSLPFGAKMLLSMVLLFGALPGLYLIISAFDTPARRAKARRRARR